MTKFPNEFSELLTTRGLRILKGEDNNACSSLRGTKNYFINLNGVIRTEKADDCTMILDKRLHDSLVVEQRGIPAESITGMKENYTEVLPKTLHFKTAFLQRKHARSFQIAEKIGLIRMMRSESYVRFAEAVSGYNLGRDYNLQVICYGHGDYAGPHNDHHPEEKEIKDGFIDFHVMFTNKAVAHQYLVYAEKGHFSKMVDINSQGGVSIYKLPFWHYTTPLWGKPGREREAHRWLLLGTFKITG
jgi:hypothetical protein